MDPGKSGYKATQCTSIIEIEREITIKGRYCPKGAGAQKLRLTVERKDRKKDRDGREVSEYATLKREVVIKSRDCSKGDKAQAKRQKETRVEKEKRKAQAFSLKIGLPIKGKDGRRDRRDRRKSEYLVQIERGNQEICSLTLECEEATGDRVASNGETNIDAYHTASKYHRHASNGKEGKTETEKSGKRSGEKRGESKREGETKKLRVRDS